MAINIKNERVIELAREASEFTGGSQTGAIEQALEGFIAARRREAAASRADLVWQTLGKIDVRLDAAQKGALQGSMDSLYDDDGLPA